MVLRDLAHLHASFMSSEFSPLLHEHWMEEMNGDKMAAMSPVWKGLLEHALAEFPEFWTSE